MKLFKRIFKIVALTLVVGVPTFLLAATPADLIGLGIPPEAANYITKNLITLNSSGNISLPVASGKTLSIPAGSITMGAAASQLIPGATSFSIRNNANNTDNLLVTNTGNTTVAGALTVSGSTSSTGKLTATAGMGMGAAQLETVAGAGSIQGDAAALSASKNFHQLTGANGTVGWIFATPVAGDFHILLNTTAGVAKLWPQSGAQINGGGANASFSALTGIKPIICFATTTSTWICS